MWGVPLPTTVLAYTASSSDRGFEPYSDFTTLRKGPEFWGKALTILSPRAKCFSYALLESWLQHTMRQEGNQTNSVTQCSRLCSEAEQRRRRKQLPPSCARLRWKLRSMTLSAFEAWSTPDDLGRRLKSVTGHRFGSA